MIIIKDDIQVKIVKMEWLSEEANEAVVTFEINNKEYRAFGFPVNFEVGASYRVEFDFLEGIEIQWEVMFSENKDKVKDLIIKPNSTWSYSAFGQIVSINPVIVDCGIAEFNLGYFSRDERLIGEYTFFDIARLDIYDKN
ncbi:hypothetical protein [Clostridium sp. JS66]|uniref:hypothetical protein n=1 Tax=Clostridium sp. JS66 TaxID=3064705 RepID=UPI00298DD3AC|nr:hypothetical protein [Clostridium sp. JS66]WPC43406.1 hypothetical protein Q6H37_08020 [Clostridium sp. JS66]